MDTIDDDIAAVRIMIAAHGGTWIVPAGLLAHVTTRVTWAAMELERRGELVMCAPTLLEQLHGAGRFVLCLPAQQSGRYRVDANGNAR